MSGIEIGVIAFLALTVLLVSGVPIAMAMMIPGFIGLTILRGADGAMIHLAGLAYTKTATYVFSVVPMFVLMGYLSEAAGITEEAFDVAKRWVGGFKGGLAISVVGAGALFGATCGSSMASAALLGKVTMPEMRKAGYSEELSSGTVAASGLLAMTIPPSVMLPIYAIIANASVGAILMTGFPAGVLTVIIYMIGIYLMVRIWPRLAPGMIKGSSFREKLASLKSLWRVVILFGLVFGGIYSGVVTPTEAGSLGAFGALIFVIVSPRKQSLKTIIVGALGETILISCFIFLVLIGAGVFTSFLGISGFSVQFSEAIVGLNLHRGFLLVVLLAMFIPLGMFLDGLSVLLLLVPLVMPIVHAAGFDPTWFGMMACLMIEIGLLTPPVGMNVFALVGAVPDLSLQSAYKGIFPFCGFTLIVIVIIAAFPPVIMWLPHLAGY